VDLGGLHGLHGQQVWEPVAGLTVGLLPKRKMVDSNPAGLEAWMPGGLEVGGSGPVALDWLGEWEVVVGMEGLGGGGGWWMMVLMVVLSHARRSERSADFFCFWGGAAPPRPPFKSAWRPPRFTDIFRQIHQE